jgi:hypothetical protein
MYRVTETALRGVRHLRAMPHGDANLETRLEQFRSQVREYAPMLPAIARFAVNDLERRRAVNLGRQIHAELGGPTALDRVKQAAVLAAAARWRLRIKLMGDTIQPRTIVTRYTAGSHHTTTLVADLSRHVAQTADPLGLDAAAAMAGLDPMAPPGQVATTGA